MTECRYVVSRLVPDLIRDEPVNVGVIVQTDELVACRFTRRPPKVPGVDGELVGDLITKLAEQWERELAKGTEWVGFPGMGTSVPVKQTDVRYLEWLKETHRQHLRFSEIRRAEVDIKGAFDVESLLLRLYDTFVSPRLQPRRVVAARGTRLHASLRRDFRPLLERKKLVDAGVVEGTILWVVDFAQRMNGTDLAIAAVDFALGSVLQRAEHVFAAWADLYDCRKDAVSRYSVVQNYRATSELRRARRLLERFATDVFDYERQREPMLEQVYDGVGEHDALYLPDSGNNR